MIRLGLRLAVAGGREAVTRLALISIAVAVGVGLLLTTLAGLNAVNAQNARYAWLETGQPGSNAPAVTAPTTDSLWWRLRADTFQGKQIGRVDVAATGPTSPIPPGLTALPGPGQYYASPELTMLLRNTPAAQLGDRYPGTQVGTLGPAALPAPNSLIIVIGHGAAELSRQDGVEQVTAVSTTVPSGCEGGACALDVGIDSNGITLILSVVAAGLLFPVLIFIGGATRLSAARREQRFAAMRLVGATPGQIAVISTVESCVAAAAGVAAGFGLFFALRPELAAIPFTGAPFYTGDLSLHLVEVLLVILGIPAAAAVAARIALRRVNVSPLGVSRRTTPCPPRAWRLVPLLAGLGELGYLAYFSDVGGAGKPVGTQVVSFMAGILLTMAGLVIAGPWLTLWGSRLMARRARRPATLIAGRRLADNPHAGFRAISGLVLALFVGTCSLGLITTIVAYNAGAAGARDSTAGLLVDGFGPDDQAPSVPDATIAELTSIPGVSGAATIHVQSESDQAFGPVQEFVSCAQLAALPALGHCPPGAQTVTIMPDWDGGFVNSHRQMASTTWPEAELSTAQLGRLPVDTIAVGTDGSTAAVERVRTVLEQTFPRTFPPQTRAELNSDDKVNGYRQLANVVILTSLPIAGCTLAVSIAGGLAERKRPFSLLRLSGTPLATLRRVVGLEAAAPLLISAAVSIGAGFLAAQLFLRAQLKETLQPPGVQYYLIVVAGVVASLGIIASTLPLLERITGPETARNE